MFSSVNYACASLYQATQLNTAMKDLLTFMEKLDTFVKKLNDVSSDDKKDAVAELRAQARTSLHTLREQISTQYDGLSKMKIDSDVKLIDLGKPPNQGKLQDLLVAAKKAIAWSTIERKHRGLLKKPKAKKENDLQ
ncbi:hypothetical protein AK812_SmicGene47116 [Symbiodinium microadriaticum]|uniref:Uncharacterized protein n=1 Tax=Symbiodinium microadriaticum TaxID=2951 RepID=A0A1Q9BSF6_SYMMI|nr:hypothetical protein AK812_SmicGene47116 [Symbiodinium microadriaticum]